MGIEWGVRCGSGLGVRVSGWDSVEQKRQRRVRDWGFE